MVPEMCHILSLHAMCCVNPNIIQGIVYLRKSIVFTRKVVCIKSSLGEIVVGVMGIGALTVYFSNLVHAGDVCNFLVQHSEGRQRAHSLACL